ncbi:hypothetical protein ACRRTK_013762 [Alexandromys fortis]
MRIPRSGELEWVEARRAGSGLRAIVRASPEGTNGLGWVPLGSAGGQGPKAEAGEGRGGKRGERGAGPIRAQLLAAAGLGSCSPRSGSNGG